ncbi:MAG: flagellar brake protein [Hydrogenobaculum sp.]
MLLTVIFLFFLVPYLIVEIKKRNKIKEEFFKKAKEYGLSDLEAELLWNYSSDHRWNIALVFNNKKVFEIVASKILKKDMTYSKLIDEMRPKLGFDRIPWFLPISTTKDIELYQSGKILFNGRQYDGVVWDKDEKYIYLALYNINKSPIKIGDVITFSFIIQDYVQISFNLKIIGISEDSGRILYKVEHSDKVVRVPIIDAVRIELSLKAHIYIPTAEELEVYEKEQILPEPEEDKFIEGVIKDLSIGGTRFCTSVFLSDLQKVFVKFRIYDKDLIIFGTIRNKFDTVDHFCYGIKFENITKEQEEDIRSYIIEQQRLLVKSYKLGEL